MLIARFVFTGVDAAVATAATVGALVGDGATRGALHALTISAIVLTWVLATAGFGATIISRAGLQSTFVRQLDLALTDEHYWTPDGMPAPPARGRISAPRQ